MGGSNNRDDDISEPIFYKPALAAMNRKFSPSPTGEYGQNRPHQHRRSNHDYLDDELSASLDLLRMRDGSGGESNGGSSHDRRIGKGNSVLSSTSNGLSTSSTIDNQPAHVYDQYRHRYDRADHRLNKNINNDDDEDDDDDRWSFSKVRDETIVAEKFFEPIMAAWKKPTGAAGKPSVSPRYHHFDEQSNDAENNVPIKLFNVNEIKSLPKLL